MSETREQAIRSALNEVYDEAESDFWGVMAEFSSVGHHEEAHAEFVARWDRAVAAVVAWEQQRLSEPSDAMVEAAALAWHGWSEWSEGDGETFADFSRRNARAALRAALSTQEETP